jgi:hypothetical protein
VLPGQWHDLAVDLAPWQNQPVVLSLTTDSEGSFYYDWALWGSPRLEHPPESAADNSDTEP